MVLLRNKIIVTFVLSLFLVFLWQCVSENRQFLSRLHLQFRSLYIDPTSEELHKCQNLSRKNPQQCPDYFAWIHEDLAPWNLTGITEELLTESREMASFRIVIVDGKLYHQQYKKCFQTREQYTIWGLLAMLERFPGMIPDMELYFRCGDKPWVPKRSFEGRTPPALFSYCTTRVDDYYDILFPDWSFWGWPEVNIRPWMEQQRQISNGTSHSWFDREPLAQWRGNILVTKVRKDLHRCKENVIVYHQNWRQETASGFRSSSLSDQCDYRYKVYAEGRGWSVSLKYIMACGSTLLQIEPEYWDFFSRSWLPYVHYLPISRNDMCSSIKHAVDWGNINPSEAATIADCGKRFLNDELTMDRVYAYMVHLLQSYAKLQRFKPSPPIRGVPLKLGIQLPELTLRKNGTNSTICILQSRDRASLDTIIAQQWAGYRDSSSFYGKVNVSYTNTVH